MDANTQKLTFSVVIDVDPCMTCDLAQITSPVYDSHIIYDISSGEAFLNELPDLNVPTGCSLTYFVSSIVANPVANAASFLTQEPKGVSWPAGTSIFSAYSGTVYTVTVKTNPQACSVQERSFTVELIECESDSL